MSVKRIIKCDVCNVSAMEQEVDGGWMGWGQLVGISLNGIPNPNLCPTHLAEVAKYVSDMAHNHARLKGELN